LIGTAHVSKESIDQVTESIKNLQPDCVAVELDGKRADSIKNPDKYGQLDIVKVIKRNEGFLLLANLVLASFQRRMGANVGVKPGDEMLGAINTANELNIPTVLADRPIQVTLRRAWAKNSLWGKCKLLAALLSSAFSKEEVSEEEIENLKNGNEMDSMMKELSDFMPVVKEVLIDERNDYLATKIWEAEGNNIVAVLGAGHLPGVEEALKKLSVGEKPCDMEEIDKVPAKTLGGKLLGWTIPAVIVGLIVAGFIYGGAKLGSQMIVSWVLANAIPAGIGSVIAAAHPLTILVSMVAAPFTSLCPFIGVGFVAGILQAIICKPKVHDMETLQDDVMSLKGWYKNRILRVLLVLLLSSLGSSIGTFAGFADIVGKFAAN
ncbi:MAG: TraB/GumN family protein, partial [Fibrobacter sp.]|nr:TraB/GumN family protein [Fibrobacter sp.]